MSGQQGCNKQFGSAWYGHNIISNTHFEYFNVAWPWPYLPHRLLRACHWLGMSECVVIEVNHPI